MIDLSSGCLFPKGSKAEGANFKGDVWQERLIPIQSEWNCPIGNVTFAPSARNNWHSHPGGQILLVTGGRGWYQEEGKPAQEICAGDVVKIPANIKHWHGAAKDSWLVHIYIITNPQAGPCEWMEPVSDEEYNAIGLSDRTE